VRQQRTGLVLEDLGGMRDRLLERSDRQEFVGDVDADEAAALCKVIGRGKGRLQEEST
jgi:hypothetical protein